MKYFVSVDGTEYTVDLKPGAGGSLSAHVVDAAEEGGSAHFEQVHAEKGHDHAVVLVGNQAFDVALQPLPDGTRRATLAGFRSEILVQSERDRQLAFGQSQARSAGGWIKSPMPGRIIKLMVQAGDTVAAGQAVVIVEAMKMQNELFAEQAGVVAEVRVQAGNTVERDAELVRLEA